MAAKKKKSGNNKGASISPGDRKKLYSARQYLNTSVKQSFGLQIPFQVYLQDPLVARKDPLLGIDDEFFANWEPGLSDGPTSARFAVVDYNGDTGRITKPAKWDKKKDMFVVDGKALAPEGPRALQFHQVNVWALLQRALAFFEAGNGLGRRIPWGFEGNRLIVLPHAGFGKNAFYDRESKSLQFYYFGPSEKTVYTCLSADIVNHEFGHALLDGVRPGFIESGLIETAAFHEFVGDMTAMLLSMRNNKFRGIVAAKTRGDLTTDENLAAIAEQFGQKTKGRPYLRSARNSLKMNRRQGFTGPHQLSQVLTGAIFDLLITFTNHYLTERKRSRGTRNSTPKEALWDAFKKVRRLAIQPLDLLPPVDVTFKDYALAMLRSEELANPVDPYEHFERILKVFVKRRILSKDDAQRLRKPHYLYHRQRLGVYHDIDSISRSRASAYRFLNDNREELFIPHNEDFIVSDLYDCNKYTREARRLPRQIVLTYTWREDVPAVGSQFGRFNGKNISMQCGGTLVFDENGNILSWARKPGTHKPGKRWQAEAEEGVRRRDEMLANVAGQIQRGRIGLANTAVGTRIPPLVAEENGKAIRFRLSPHMHLSEGHEDEEFLGDRQWEISC